MNTESEVTPVNVSNSQRRTMLKAAAWAAPVVAVAASAPLAAASAGQANYQISVGSQINANPTAGTAHGTLNGALNITNVVGSWATGVISAYYRLQGPWGTSALTENTTGAPFVLGNTYGVWTVTYIDQDAYGVWEVRFEAPSREITANTAIQLPAATYTGTFAGATARNPINATVAFDSDIFTGSNSSGYPVN